MGLISLFKELMYKKNKILRPFAGVYRGFAPSGESRIEIGELEIKISQRVVKKRLATGKGIQEEQILASEFTMMFEEELCRYLPGGSSMADQTVGFLALGVQYFFHLGAIDKPGLTVVDPTIIVNNPTILYNPEQIQRDTYIRAVALIEIQCGRNCIPLLAANGK